MNKLASPDYQLAAVHATPLYAQLSTIFRSLIREGKWTVGSALPSEAELARRYGVSVGTARKALESLDESGWITRRQGRGTFVSDPAEQQFDRFCRIFLNDSRTSLFGVCSAKSLVQAIAPATEEEARAFGVDHLPLVTRLERVFEKDGAPVMVEHQVLLADLFPNLANRTDLPVNLYGVFLRDYGIAIHRCTETIVAAIAPPKVSAALDVDAGTPVLRTSHKVEDVDGTVIGLVRRWFETKSVEYMVALT